ncbi:hypothetical protein GCM10009753_28590 [Streptantibioticus ferralitis]
MPYVRRVAWGCGAHPGVSVTGPWAEQGEKGACPMNLGLLSAAAAVVYAVTVSLLAITATFARRAVRRREARATLVLLVPRRHADCPAGVHRASRADRGLDVRAAAADFSPSARSEAPDAARSRW